MDQEQCQKEPGGVVKVLAPSGISFLRLSPIKIALVHENSRGDFIQNGEFQLFSESFLPRFWRISGIKWIKSVAKRSMEVF